MLKKWGLVGVDSIYLDKDKDMRPPFVNIIIHFGFYKGQVISWLLEQLATDEKIISKYILRN